jgi:hypothetical protein
VGWAGSWLEFLGFPLRAENIKGFPLLPENIKGFPLLPENIKGFPEIAIPEIFGRFGKGICRFLKKLRGSANSKPRFFFEEKAIACCLK